MYNFLLIFFILVDSVSWKYYKRWNFSFCTTDKTFICNRSHYKRLAFLRCEEEKEQFLYHLLTLNAVDYFCFTNNYPTTKLPYRVIIFPSRKASAATTSANSWISISGTLGETTPVTIPKGALEFVFHVSFSLLDTVVRKKWNN